MTGLAAPTPVTDGRRVYAVFPTGEVAAFDLSGKQVWARNIGPLENTYGFAASPTLYQDRLILQLDLGDSTQSRMLALDTRTGRELWKTPRPTGSGWASPVVAEFHGRLQLITCGNPFVIGYDPADGKELWRIKALEGDIAPSPIVVGDRIIAISSSVFALKPGVSDPAWQFDDSVPDIASAVSDGRHVYLLGPGGSLNCVDAQTGKAIWSQELDGRFSASPVIVEKTLLLFCEGGVAILVETGEQYKELGRREIGDDCVASPALVGDRLYIRGKNFLFCIGKR
jgi:outer membrane protein assembly factor BamB